MYDLEYVSWLEVNHPDAVPADRYSLIEASTTIPSVSTPTVSPSVMIPTNSPSVMIPTTSPALMAPTVCPLVMNPTTSPVLMAPTTPDVSALEMASTVSPSLAHPNASTTVMAPSVIAPTASPMVSALPSVAPPSAVSKFLTPIRPQMSCKTGGASVLTSAECLAMLEEKQLQKKKETEEKEKEREEKKKQREEEAKRKVAKREEKKKQREALMKKKDEEKRKKDQEKTNQRVRKAQEKATNLKGKPAKQAIASNMDVPTRKRVADTAEPSEPPPSKKMKVKDSSGTEVNQNQCCICFGTFDKGVGTDREWVECACTRWLHEDCVEEVVVDVSGLERLCPLCLS